MVNWGLNKPCRFLDYLLLFFPLFERASTTFYQHLICHIWSDNEYVVIALNFTELLNFC